MNISDRIEKYLKEEEDDDLDYDYDEFFDDSELMDRMVDFITSLEMDSLPEDKQIELGEIIDMVTEDEMEEAISAKRVKIDPAERRKRRREYRKKKAKIKMKLKRYRRTAQYKKYERMKKRKAKSGKTASGKRIRQFI